jgi:putative FmdB family regulatory protein
MTYEYRCESCKHEWETEQRITEPPVKHCPACGMERARRLISGKPAHILVGDGWFKTGGY